MNIDKMLNWRAISVEVLQSYFKFRADYTPKDKVRAKQMEHIRKGCERVINEAKDIQ